MMLDTKEIMGNIEEYLKKQGEKTMLRLLTCGSVDDGKSTLIGRLLWDSKALCDDQITNLEIESKQSGNAGGDIDFALLLDGLEAEREQGITIDVAYRFFTTDKRKYIIADTPGHEEYTRNMATGASTADAAILLVDARKGILPQTRRHARILSLMGIKNVALIVNKMDIVSYDEASFTEIAIDFNEFAKDLGFDEIATLPISALKGVNIIGPSDIDEMAWYKGNSLLEWLENLTIDKMDYSNEAFRFPVQWVNRPHLDFRGFAGTIASGSISVGDEIVVVGSGKRSKIARIVTMDGDLETAQKGEAVTFTLEDEIDISRGDMLSDIENIPPFADQFEAQIIWTHQEPMLPSRPYLLKMGNSTVNAQVSSLKYKLDVNNGDHIAAKTLELNEIACCNISIDKPLAFDPYDEIKETGNFILIDRFSNATIAMGVVDFPLRRATNIHMHALDIDHVARSEAKNQEACLLWFTGLSGSGKSTIANMVEKKLFALGKHTYMLDGDNVRHGLNRDLGFTDADRVENIRRIGEVGGLFVDAGLITLAAFISPFKSERQMARNIVEKGRFLEVFIDTPLEVCESRDVKGLYKKARAGELKNFTGIDSDYERPENAEIIIDGANLSIEEAADKVIEYLKEKGFCG